MVTVADNLVCCLLAETREATETIDAICVVPGIQPDFLAAVAAVAKVLDTARRHAIPLGNVAIDKARAEIGFAAGCKGYRGV